MTKGRSSLLLVLCVGGAAVLAAPKLTGKQIMQKVNDNDNSRDVRYSAQMILKNAEGKQRLRKYNMWRITRGEKAKTMMKFTSPAIDKDIGLLTDDRGHGDTTQYLFLPKLNEIKRILGSDKRKAFMGSDFAYEDFEKKHVDDYSYKVLKEDAKVGAIDCYVVQSMPRKGLETQYSKTVNWVDKKRFVVLKSLLYVKGKIAKVMYNRKFQKISGIHTPMWVEMKTIAQGHTTVMRLKGVKYNTDLAGSYFTRRYLKRRG